MIQTWINQLNGLNKSNIKITPKTTEAQSHERSARTVLFRSPAAFRILEIFRLDDI